MRIRLYSIFDKQLKAYLAPFPARADVEAIRQLRAGFDDPQMKQTPVCTHPQDYELLCLGVLDDETGKIDNEGFPSFVIQVSKVKEADNGRTVDEA